MKYKAFEGCSSLSLDGQNIEIIEGIVDVEGHQQFLLCHGFTPVVEETQPSELDLLKAEADALGVKYPHNIGIAKLAALVAEAKIPADENKEEA